MSSDLARAYCSEPLSVCAVLRDDDRWLGQHAARPDVVELRKQQRLARIRWGHETESGIGILRADAGIRPGHTTNSNDDTALMLRQINKQRRQ